MGLNAADFASDCRIARVLYVAVRDELYAKNLRELTDDELVHCFYKETRKNGLLQIRREMRRRERGEEKGG